MGSLPSTFCLVLLLLSLAASPQTANERGDLLEKQGLAALRQQRYQDALIAFEELLSREPDRASAHYGKGLAFTGILNYSAAAGSFEKAVSLQPALADAWRRLVVLYSQLNRDASTKRAYEKARRLAKVPAEERLSLARALRKTGWIKEARAMLHEAQPLGVNEHLELGLLALGEDDYSEAAGHLQAATSDPSRSTADAEYQYGRTLEALGHTEQAIEHYRRAMSKDPRMRSARFRLGNLMLRSGNAEQGRGLLHGYEQFRQWDRRVKLLLAMVTSGTLSDAAEREKTLELVNLLLQGGALEDAAALIHSALAKNPDDPAFRVAQARWLLSSGQPDKARAVVELLLSLPNPPPDALWYSARLHILQGEWPEAIESFHRLLAIDPDPPAALLKELATAYGMNGQTDEAASYYHRALEKDPLLAGAHAGLGSLLESTGRREEAERHYRRALEIDPDLLSAQQLLAELLLQRGDAEEAVTLFRRSVTTNPADALLRRNLARALQRLGKTEEAEAELEKARQIEAWKSQPAQ
jgi:tetratricopeptide (TPR) repeat protein